MRKILWFFPFAVLVATFSFARDQSQANASNNASPAANAPYPVRPTDLVPKDSEATLTQKLKKMQGDEIYPLTMERYLPVIGRGKPVDVRTCSEYKSARAEGMIPTSDHFAQVAFSIFDETCFTEVYIRLAKPSLKSYVADFDLTKNPLKELPSGVAQEPSEIEGPTLSDGLTHSTKVEMRSPNSIYIDDGEKGGVWHVIDCLGHGDFNSDGVEDILLHVNTGFTYGSWRSSGFVLLTKTSPEGRLQLLSDKEHEKLKKAVTGRK